MSGEQMGVAGAVLCSLVLFSRGLFRGTTVWSLRSPRRNSEIWMGCKMGSRKSCCCNTVGWIVIV